VIAISDAMSNLGLFAAFVLVGVLCYSAGWRRGQRDAAAGKHDPPDMKDMWR
jgi:hypothetical protein